MKRPTDAEFVYLDSNAIIDVCDGKLDGLKSDISAAVESGGVVYPFSAAQVSEITAYPLTERCRTRLELLSVLSKDIYFVHSVYDYEFRIQSPFAVYETLTEALPELNENKLFAIWTPHDQVKSARQQFGLDPVRLNNFSGAESGGGDRQSNFQCCSGWSYRSAIYTRNTGSNKTNHSGTLLCTVETDGNH